MLDRDFTEADLRTMFENIKGYKPDIVEGRWVIITMRCKRIWEVIVEPDFETKRLVVITAYPYSGS